MKRLWRYASVWVLCAFCLLLVGCAHNQPSQCPRRVAYPRVAEIDSVMIQLDSDIEWLLVNKAAEVTQPRDRWYDVRYEMYGATIHITNSAVNDSTIGAVKRNRMERIILNNGDRPAQESEFVNRHGIAAFVSVCESSPTPIQFIATDEQSIVISGVVRFDFEAPADSLRPIIKVLTRDVLRGLGAE